MPVFSPLFDFFQSIDFAPGVRPPRQPNPMYGPLPWDKLPLVLNQDALKKNIGQQIHQWGWPETPPAVIDPQFMRPYGPQNPPPNSAITGYDPYGNNWTGFQEGMGDRQQSPPTKDMADALRRQKFYNATINYNVGDIGPNGPMTQPATVHTPPFSRFNLTPSLPSELGREGKYPPISPIPPFGQSSGDPLAYDEVFADLLKNESARLPSPTDPAAQPPYAPPGSTPDDEANTRRALDYRLSEFNDSWQEMQNARFDFTSAKTVQDVERLAREMAAREPNLTMPDASGLVFRAIDRMNEIESQRLGRDLTMAEASELPDLTDIMRGRRDPASSSRRISLDDELRAEVARELELTLGRTPSPFEIEERAREISQHRLGGEEGGGTGMMEPGQGEPPRGRGTPLPPELRDPRNRLPNPHLLLRPLPGFDSDIADYPPFDPPEPGRGVTGMTREQLERLADALGGGGESASFPKDEPGLRAMMAKDLTEELGRAPTAAEVEAEFQRYRSDMLEDAKAELGRMPTDAELLEYMYPDGYEPPKPSKAPSGFEVGRQPGGVLGAPINRFAGQGFGPVGPIPTAGDTRADRQYLDSPAGGSMPPIVRDEVARRQKFFDALGDSSNFYFNPEGMLQHKPLDELFGLNEADRRQFAPMGIDQSQLKTPPILSVIPDEPTILPFPQQEQLLPPAHGDQVIGPIKIGAEETGVMPEPGTRESLLDRFKRLVRESEGKRYTGHIDPNDPQSIGAARLGGSGKVVMTDADRKRLSDAVAKSGRSARDVLKASGVDPKFTLRGLGIESANAVLRHLGEPLIEIPEIPADFEELAVDVKSRLKEANMHDVERVSNVSYETIRRAAGTSYTKVPPSYEVLKQISNALDIIDDNKQKGVPTSVPRARPSTSTPPGQVVDMGRLGLGEAVRRGPRQVILSPAGIKTVQDAIRASGLSQAQIARMARRGIDVVHAVANGRPVSLESANAILGELGQEPIPSPPYDLPPLAVQGIPSRWAGINKNEGYDEFHDRLRSLLRDDPEASMLGGITDYVSGTKIPAPSKIIELAEKYGLEIPPWIPADDTSRLRISRFRPSFVETTIRNYVRKLVDDVGILEAERVLDVDSGSIYAILDKSADTPILLEPKTVRRLADHFGVKFPPEMGGTVDPSMQSKLRQAVREWIAVDPKNRTMSSLDSAAELSSSAVSHFLRGRNAKLTTASAIARVVGYDPKGLGAPLPELPVELPDPGPGVERTGSLRDRFLASRQPPEFFDDPDLMPIYPEGYKGPKYAPRKYGPRPDEKIGGSSAHRTSQSERMSARAGDSSNLSLSERVSQSGHSYRTIEDAAGLPRNALGRMLRGEYVLSPERTQVVSDALDKLGIDNSKEVRQQRAAALRQRLQDGNYNLSRIAERTGINIHSIYNTSSGVNSSTGGPYVPTFERINEIESFLDEFGDEPELTAKRSSPRLTSPKGTGQPVDQPVPPEYDLVERYRPMNPDQLAGHIMELRKSGQPVPPEAFIDLHDKLRAKSDPRAVNVFGLADDEQVARMVEIYRSRQAEIPSELVTRMVGHTGGSKAGGAEGLAQRIAGEKPGLFPDRGTVGAQRSPAFSPDQPSGLHGTGEFLKRPGIKGRAFGTALDVAQPIPDLTSPYTYGTYGAQKGLQKWAPKAMPFVSKAAAPLAIFDILGMKGHGGENPAREEFERLKAEAEINKKKHRAFVDRITKAMWTSPDSRYQQAIGTLKKQYPNQVLYDIARKYPELLHDAAMEILPRRFILSDNDLKAYERDVQSMIDSSRESLRANPIIDETQSERIYRPEDDVFAVKEITKKYPVDWRRVLTAMGEIPVGGRIEGDITELERSGQNKDLMKLIIDYAMWKKDDADRPDKSKPDPKIVENMEAIIRKIAEWEAYRFEAIQKFKRGREKLDKPDYRDAPDAPQQRGKLDRAIDRLENTTRKSLRQRFLENASA